MKTDKDWREIDKRMSQTLEIRRKMIDCRAPLKDILTMFPFLKCPYQVSYSNRTVSGLGVMFASSRSHHVCSFLPLSSEVVTRQPGKAVGVALSMV